MKRVVAGWVLGLAGCGAERTMQVHPDFGPTAVRAQGVRELRLYLGHGAAVRGLAVYHTDEALIPAPVRALGAQSFPGRPVLYFETEWHAAAGGAQALYEVQYDLGEGTSGEVSALADGTLLYVEQPIALDALPPAIRTAALAVVPGTLVEAESKVGPGLDQVDLKLTHEGRTHVLVMSRDGALLWHALRFPAQVEVPVP